MGVINTNTLLDTKIYEVDLDDGTVYKLLLNSISDSLYPQCNNYGFVFQVLYDIVYHKYNSSSVKLYYAFSQSNSGLQCRKITSVWDICFQCNYENSSWDSLNELK